jgi:hypothetical protein
MHLIFTVPVRDLPHFFLLGRVKHTWAKHGSAIIDALQETSGIQFSHSAVVKVQFCKDPNWWDGGAGHTRKRAISISLPKSTFAAYDEAIIWLLAHELGHRLLDQHNLEFNYNNFVSEEDWHYYQHKLLFIFLIDSLAHALDSDQYRKLLKNLPCVGYSGDDGTSRAWKWANNLAIAERRSLVRESIIHRHIDALLESS